VGKRKCVKAGKVAKKKRGEQNKDVGKWKQAKESGIGKMETGKQDSGRRKAKAQRENGKAGKRERVKRCARQ